MAALLACGASAQEAPPDEPLIVRRAREAAALLREDPAWPDGLFDDAFRRNVPASDLRRLLGETYAAEGTVTSVLRVRGGSPLAGRFEFACEKGGVLQCDLRIADDPMGAIRFFRTYASVPGYRDLESASRAFGALDGRVSFAVARLGSDQPEPIAGAGPDEALNIASAYKLYLLGALVEEIRAGRRAWTDTVPLDPRRRSLPTGILQRWPDGSPVTLYTLAALMVERSDNTAADHLLFLLGREKVESMLAAMGHGHVERNLPLLSTGEMFRLVFADGGKHAPVYAAKGVAERRAYLADVIAGIPPERIDSPTGRVPRSVDSIGWFASARDLCAAMDWLFRATESGPAAAARAILAIEPGTTDPPDVFPYQGYKGGRLAGIVSRAYLVRAEGGASFAVAGIWNDGRKDPDEALFARMATRALQLLAREP